ncbi:MAG: hypothetical protein QOH51_3502 [Acidobacteriota bacterium]|jgi:hypothetical protein|nr:hypothetical protein [Acidobacteriota bacterium]
MRYELWQDEEEGRAVALTFFPVDEIYELRRRLLEPRAHLIWTVEADTYEDAMRLYHEHMDWEPYRPWADEQA